MTTARRTDVHSPSNLVTEDYDFFACGEYGTADEPGYSPINTPMGQKLLADGWRFAGINGGGCDHCGARLRYYALLLHAPSHKIIRVGETCLDNRFSLATGEFHKLRKAAKLNRERKALADVRAEWAAEHGDVVAFLSEKVADCEARYGFVPDPELDGYLSGLRFWEFYLSLNAQMLSKGFLSERQVEAVRKSAVKDAARKAEREAENANALPVPTGKITVTGTITKIDLKVNDFGSREVMTVKTEDGYKLWGTQPAALYETKVGDVVTFTATVEPSKNDPYFGYFKRPSKASVVSEV